MTDPSTAAEINLGDRRSLRTLAGSNAIAWAVLAGASFLVTAVLFRAIGPAAFGVWATIAALRGFALFLDGGLVFGAARSSANLETDRDGSLSAISAANAAGIACGLIVAVAAVALAWLPAALLGLTGDEAAAASLTMVILGVESGLALAAAPLHGAARGLERFDLIALGAVLQGGISLALVLVLAPSFGIVGAAVALLVARSAELITVILVFRRSYPAVLSAHRSPGATRKVLAFTVPLWVIAIGTQIGLGTDVPIVGAFFGAEAAGAYALGAVIPATALALLYALTDAAYPRIVRSGTRASGLVLRVIAMATTMAGLGFTVTFVLAPQLLEVWVGVADPLSVDVLRIYCVAWAVNVPAHILVLHSMASSTHHRLAPIVVIEALVSLALGITLASAGLAQGPALATLATLAVSNLIVVPALTLPRTGVTVPRFAGTVVVCSGAGLLAGVAISVIVGSLAVEPIVSVAVAGLVTSVAAVAVLFLATRYFDRFQRLGVLVRHGGIIVWRRQRREVQDAKVGIQLDRIEQPILWIPSSPPLVSVRIATYNRGVMVRDRAIASALSQTYTNIEVVVVGDRCDPATEAAVRSVRDPRVRFENLAERGQYPADPRFRWMVAGSTPMNRALDLAKGEWIAPLDDDDEFTSDHVDVLIDACRSRGLELAYGIAEMETDPGRWAHVGSEPLRHGQIVHATVLFHRRLASIRHDLDAWRLGEPGDWNVWHRMRDAGAVIGFVDHVVSKHYLERRETR